jgi:hypothetical protein
VHLPHERFIVGLNPFIPYRVWHWVEVERDAVLRWSGKLPQLEITGDLEVRSPPPPAEPTALVPPGPVAPRASTPGRRPGEGSKCAILAEFERLLAEGSVHFEYGGLADAARKVKAAFPVYSVSHIRNLITDRFSEAKSAQKQKRRKLPK